MRKVLVAILVTLLCVGVTFAAAKGTAKEAKAMVDKAVALLKSSGPDKAFPAFNDQKGKFRDRDLYIWVADMNANMKCVAHGANPALIGKELIEFKDSDGKLFIKEIYEMAKSKGSGWVDYKWTNPESKKIEQKSVYLEKFNNYVVVCGFYK